MEQEDVSVTTTLHLPLCIPGSLLLPEKSSNSQSKGSVLSSLGKFPSWLVRSKSVC